MDRNKRRESGVNDTSRENSGEREALKQQRIQDVEQEAERFLAGGPEFLKTLTVSS